MNSVLTTAAAILVTFSALGTTTPPQWEQIIQNESVRYSTSVEALDSIGLNRKSKVFHFHRSKNGQTATWNEGDLRYLALETHSFTDLSYSDNNGWNYGAFPYFHNGQFHLLGGYGFWEEHFHDIVFLESRNEWERVTGDGPLQGQIQFLAKRMFETGHDSIAYLDWRVSAEHPNETSYLWTRPISSNNWTARLSIPAVASPGGIEHCFDLAEYVLFGQHNGTMLLIRKSDWNYQVLFDNEAWVKMQRAGEIDHVVVFDDAVQLRNIQGVTHTIALQDLLGSLSESNWTPLGILVEEGGVPSAGTVESLEPSTAALQRRYSPWLLILLGIGIGISVGLWRGRRRRPQGVENPLMNLAELNLSPALFSVLTESGNIISIPEFDRLMPAHPDLTPEGVRSRRARFFRELNEESEAVFGFPILLRQRSASDSRMYEYHRRPLPKWIEIS